MVGLAALVLLALAAAAVVVGRVVFLDRSISYVSFIVQTYRSRYWWVEGAVLARRVLFAAAAALLHNTAYVSLALAAVLVASLLVFLVTMPHRTLVASWLEVATTAAALVTLIAAESMASSSRATTQARLSASILLVNGTAVLALLVGFTLPLWWSLGPVS